MAAAAAPEETAPPAVHPAEPHPADHPAEPYRPPFAVPAHLKASLPTSERHHKVRAHSITLGGAPPSDSQKGACHAAVQPNSVCALSTRTERSCSLQTEDLLSSPSVILDPGGDSPLCALQRRPGGGAVAREAGRQAAVCLPAAGGSAARLLPLGAGHQPSGECRTCAPATSQCEWGAPRSW